MYKERRPDFEGSLATNNQGQKLNLHETDERLVPRSMTSDIQTTLKPA